MTYAPGGDLTRWMRADAPLAEPAARTIISEVLLALDHLHAHGIIYRDLKPENTLVGADGHVMLADFGVSKVLGRAGGGGGGAHARTFIGTPDYMAPEMFSGDGYGPSVDFWAMGVLLHELLTTELPLLPPEMPLHSAWTHAPRVASGLPAAARELLQSMLRLQVGARLGGAAASASADVRLHAFFAGVDWAALMRKEVPAPLTLGKLTSDNMPEDTLRKRRMLPRARNASADGTKLRT